MYKDSFKLVFYKPSYIVLAISLFAILFVLLLHTRELLFFEPYFVFHLPEDSVLSFSLIIIVSSLMAIVTSMAIYRVSTFKTSSKKMGGGLVGSIIGTGAGICTTCGPLGFTIISTFGIAGASTLNFLTYYEIPMRVIAIGILSITYFLMVKGISVECKNNIIRGSKQ